MDVVLNEPERRPYANPGSGVAWYEPGTAFIHVWFRGQERGYVYNDEKPGRAHVEAMKRLAEQGRGLATYISRHVGENFAGRV